MLDRVAHLVIMLVAGVSLQLMNLVSHCMVMYLVLQCKSLRFVSLSTTGCVLEMYIEKISLTVLLCQFVLMLFDM